MLFQKVTCSKQQYIRLLIYTASIGMTTFSLLHTKNENYPRFYVVLLLYLKVEAIFICYDPNVVPITKHLKSIYRNTP